MQYPYEVRAPQHCSCFVVQQNNGSAHPMTLPGCFCTLCRRARGKWVVLGVLSLTAVLVGVLILIYSVEVGRVAEQGRLDRARVTRAQNRLLRLRRCSNTFILEDIISTTYAVDGVWSERGTGTAVVMRRSSRPMTSLAHDTVFLTTLAQVCKGCFAYLLCLSASTCHCLTHVFHIAAASTIKP